MRPVIEPVSFREVAPTRDADYDDKLAKGKELSDLIDLYKQNEELKRLAGVIKAQATDDRLSPSQFEQLRSHQEATMAVEQRKKYFKETNHDYSFHGIAYNVINDLLQKDRAISSVLNIGCNYAYMDSMLASHYENVDFMGVDVNEDTVAKNSDLLRHNLSIKSGYALDLIEKEEITADLIYMSSTATVIRNEELRRYIRAFSSKAKYVLFSEPVWVLPGNVLDDTRNLSSRESVPAYVQRDPLTGSYGYLCWNHNYAVMLEESGFDVVIYKFYRPEFTYLYWNVVLAQNANEDLW